MSPSPVDEKAIFNTARKITDPEALASYLSLACGEDEAARQRIHALLAIHDHEDSFLESPPPGIEPTQIRPVSERSGDTIGPYKLLQQIGEGGMGTVFMAEQTEPVERRVALKIIKPGMDTQQVIARFEAERQALAMMDHPNIAKVLDAGTTDTGRPYFVMELVKGMPVTQYCDEQHLSPRERLELFVPICQAVQHAHQKGIIHRDLKPSNILIARYDDKPVPKIIDFGVVKATSQRLTEKTMFTQYGQIVGTMEYMAPEQANFNQLDVDTRSDIYSLGVLLYELLTGETPFDKKRLRSAAFDELLRIIREEEPPRPSTRLSSSQSLANTAVNRKTEPKKLSLLVRGELDWIVMKALEKDRSRRYETASKFAEDVSHYLKNEAVLACPPSATYRFRKFAQRNRLLVTSTSAVMLSLMIAIAGTTWGLIRAESARVEAVAAKTEAERLRSIDQQRAESEQEAHRQTRRERDRAVAAEADTAAFSRFLIEDVLASARPKGIQGGRGVDLTMAQALSFAEPRISEVFQDRWRAEAMTRHAIGVTWRQLGEYDKSEQQLRRAIELLESHDISTSDVLLRECRNSLAVNLFQQKRYREALPILEDLLKLFSAEFGPKHRATLRCRMHIAGVYLQLRKLTTAREMYEQILVDQQPQFSENDPDRLEALSNLAKVYYDLAEYQKSCELYESVLPHLEGLNDRNLAAFQQNLAIVYYRRGRNDRGFELYRAACLTALEILGPSHPDFLQVLRTMASITGRSGQSEQFDKVLDALRLQVSNRYGSSSEQYATFQSVCAPLQTTERLERFEESTTENSH